MWITMCPVDCWTPYAEHWGIEEPPWQKWQDLFVKQNGAIWKELMEPRKRWNYLQNINKYTTCLLNQQELSLLATYRQCSEFAGQLSSFLQSWTHSYQMTLLLSSLVFTQMSWKFMFTGKPAHKQALKNFIIAQIWKPPRCPSLSKWIHRLWWIQRETVI
jgi:hypothetical protein